MLWLAVCLIFECIQTQTNCLRCLEDDGCVFCLTDSMCYEANSSALESCEEIEDVRTDRCVQELGGDANKSVRYAIGFSVLAATIVVDAVVRIISRRRSSVDEYRHL